MTVKHTRHLHYRCKVHRIMEVTLRSRPITKVGNNRPVRLLPRLHRPRDPRRMEHVRPDRNTQRRNVHTLRELGPTLITHPVLNDIMHRHPVHKQSRILAVRRHNPVVPLHHRKRRPNRVRFLPLVLRIGPHPSRTLQLKRDLIKLPTNPHLLIQIHNLIIAQRVLRELLIKLPILIKDLQVLNFRFIHSMVWHNFSYPMVAQETARHAPRLRRFINAGTSGSEVSPVGL